MKILITGGAGFIGSHLVEALAADGHVIVILDNLTTGRRENLPARGDPVMLLEGDVRDPMLVRKALSAVELVIHLAAFVSVPESIKDPVTSCSVNVDGTVLLLEEARRAGVKRFILASSAAVYGEPASVPVAESHPQSPLSPYGVHKLSGEHLARVAARGGDLDTLSLRFFNVYGPRQRHDSDYAAVVPIFQSRCRRGLRPCIRGDGKQTRDFIYVGDLVEGFRRIIASSTRWGGEVMNLARGESTTIRALADLVMEMAGMQGEPEFAPPRAGDIAHSVADVLRLRSALAWTPPTPLAEGLKLCAASE